MKTILIVLLVVMGLYSCEKEPTSAIQVEKKYTLEEILADTNWVEITDTLHYQDINGFTYLNNNWDNNDLILFTNEDDYKKIETLSDTTYEWYKPNSLKKDIDFKKYTLIGVRTETTRVRIKKLIFLNHKINQYQYFVKIYSTIPETRVFVRSFNFLLIPKIDLNYQFYVDTLRIWEN